MNIDAATRLLLLLGDPVSHSISPQIHNAWLADHDLDAAYVALRLTGPAPVETIRALGRLGLVGANVTTPHKAAAAQAADRSEDEVANTLRWEPDGTLSAFNTDGLGFIDALAEADPEWRRRRVLFVGAGGAALGIAKSLAPEANSLVFLNRTLERAEAAASKFANASALSWDRLPEAFEAADLIVQTTTLGMHGADAAPAWPVHVCKGGTLVADIVYRPLETELLRVARARGLATLDGLGMLIHQAARAFYFWFGIHPDTGLARARAMRALQQ